jgi:hypothetical protein
MSVDAGYVGPGVSWFVYANVLLAEAVGLSTVFKRREWLEPACFALEGLLVLLLHIPVIIACETESGRSRSHHVVRCSPSQAACSRLCLASGRCLSVPPPLVCRRGLLLSELAALLRRPVHILCGCQWCVRCLCLRVCPNAMRTPVLLLCSRGRLQCDC